MKKSKIIGFVFGVITIVFSLISMTIAITNSVGLYSEKTIIFTGISSVSLLISSITMIMIQLKKRKENEVKLILRFIKKLNKNDKFNTYHYFYAIMYELKYGGRALIVVHQKYFFNNNWRCMLSKFKRVILNIYKMYNSNEIEFEELFISLNQIIYKID